MSHRSLSFFGTPGVGATHLHHRKAKGEWAEMVFIAKATALGFTVCKPYGDYHPFDFLVRASGRTCAVQVKSGWVEARGAYQIRTSRLLSRRFHTGHKTTRAYRADEVDFIVAFVVPEDTWYVIPVGAVRRICGIALYPHVTRSRGRFERYREAWHLLAQPAPTRVNPGSKAAPTRRNSPPSLPRHRDRVARVAWEALGEWLFSRHGPMS